MESLLSYALLVLGTPLTLVGAVICFRWYLFWRRNYTGGLITFGPFAQVRHPFYSGFLAFTIGLALTMPATDTLALAIISIMSISYYMPREEQELLRIQERVYREYMERVPWRLIPRVY
jgi:protein-S-isoprenylcysteine O-methyltransferase Ste14